MEMNKCFDQLTNHARWRQFKRGIRDNILEIYQKYADLEIYAKGSAFKSFISDNAAQMAIKDGINSNDIERAKKICAISRNGKILTIYHRNKKPSKAKTIAPKISEVWA